MEWGFQLIIRIGNKPYCISLWRNQFLNWRSASSSALLPPADVSEPDPVGWKPYSFVTLWSTEAKLNIYFKAVVILSHPYFSSGKAFGNDNLIFARAALFYKYSGFLGYIRLCKYLYLLNRQGHLKFNELLPKFRMGLKGIKKYKELRRSGQETRS